MIGVNWCSRFQVHQLATFFEETFFAIRTNSLSSKCLDFRLQSLMMHDTQHKINRIRVLLKFSLQVLLLKF